MSIKVLVAALRSSLEECDSFSYFRDHISPLFIDLLRSAEIMKTIREDLARLAHLERTQSVDELRFDDRLGRLELSLATPDPPQSLEGSAGHLLLGVVGGTLVVNRFCHERRVDPSVVNRACQLRLVESTSLRIGEVCMAEAWKEVLDACGDALVLSLRTPPTYPVAWTYSRSTLLPTGLSPATRHLGRLQDSLVMLRHVGAAHDADVCCRLAHHPAHAIRWEAIRTAYALGHPSANALLSDAATDVHPEIREAAIDALRQRK